MGLVQRYFCSEDLDMGSVQVPWSEEAVPSRLQSFFLEELVVGFGIENLYVLVCHEFLFYLDKNTPNLTKRALPRISERHMNMRTREQVSVIIYFSESLTWNKSSINMK